MDYRFKFDFFRSSDRKDMGYPMGYPIPLVPWDGTSMG